MYSQLVGQHVPHLAPELLHAEQASPKATMLFLEALPHRRWRWHDVDVSAAVLEQVATLHTAALHANAVLLPSGIRIEPVLHGSRRPSPRQ